MSLYEYLQQEQRDFDTADTVYDSIITVCCIDTEMPDTYDSFCMELYKLVNVVEIVDTCTIVVDWSVLIKKNKQQFLDFTQQYWKDDYTDEDVFMLAWLHELHLYLAGYVADGFYTVLLRFVKTLESV